MYSVYFVFIAAIFSMYFAGRVGFGFISDLKCVNRLMLYNTAVTMAGIVTIFCGMVPNYIWLACYSSVYGVLIGEKALWVKS